MAGTADIDFRDGLIFISGGEAGKVMVFNSYGDLITYVYDPKKNPGPVTMDDEEESISVSTWSFRNPRAVAAYDGGFLVEDGVEAERRVEDSQTGVFYDRVVLRFDINGQYLGYLGREGFNSTPFPYISSMDVRVDGSLVVSCRIPGVWESYWFSQYGDHITTTRIEEDQLPGLGEGGNVAVYSIHPDPTEWTMHIRLDFYPDTKTGDKPEARLYTWDLETMHYGDPIILNYIEGSPEDGIPSIPPDYLGTAWNGLHFMLSPEGPGRYRMMLIDDEGRLILNRGLKVNESSTIYRRFRLQNDGMLTGIFFDDREAVVSWWRGDKLIENER